MLPTSVRRVASAAPQSPILTSFASPIAHPRAALVAAYGRRSLRPNSHQRRLSSSKPSSPDNGGSNGLPPTSADAKSTTSSSQSGKATAAGGSESSSGNTEKRKRRANKDGAAAKKLSAAPGAQYPRLPSVPDTTHVPQSDVALSSFFSLHRPISVTHSFPKTVSEDAFAAIFTPRTQAQKSSDTVSTLSRVVDDLEQPMANMSLNGQQHQDALDAAAADGVTKIDLRHADGSETSVYVQLSAMAGQFLPFRPPPAPETGATGAPSSSATAASAEAGVESAIEGLAEDAEEAAMAHHEQQEQQAQHRVYKAILTIEETTDANGEIKVLAHSPQLIDQATVPRTFLERMALRQLTRYYDEDGRPRDGQRTGILPPPNQQNGGMWAISVKRQRKLKMKKKKYKKLMRRTRNERRKLDRL